MRTDSLIFTIGDTGDEELYEETIRNYYNENQDEEINEYYQRYQDVVNMIKRLQHEKKNVLEKYYIDKRHHIKIKKDN